ncbi:hypothetical protein L226DRAFT_548610 [Lentinus tigrinus ALCF2SS1-7]|uniref:Uncharacterized protein n=1 Tax=Lentinus tigrinus ALCF2SS1-6 TaxID=1328759 RepID=A0A5C2RQS4_9APHY|nr:hypothetical protein L227DRAFT_589544 [Lentinus tigrinus ALCF2SS1-6]RPD68253.1 hypothetical protein L226DRAFT_548610 [Lentinus tigrinus ALCF2SS1-7]
MTLNLSLKGCSGWPWVTHGYHTTHTHIHLYLWHIFVTPASVNVAVAFGDGAVSSQNVLPHSVKNTWMCSLIDKQPNLKEALSMHLMGVGKYVCTLDILHFMAEPGNLWQFDLTKAICLLTAQSWMHEPGGQFKIFLSTMLVSDLHAHQWDSEGNEIPVPLHVPHPFKHCVVYWWHDKSIFYEHDSKKAVPCTKGEGVSLMAADLVLANYGWLCSLDGKVSAHHMSKYPTQLDKPMFSMETNILGPNGNPIYSPDGKILKKIPMCGHPRTRLPMQCPQVKCKPPALSCCCCRLLFNQPNFWDVETLLETHCKARSFTVLFLLKFHSKCEYRKCPVSSAKANLSKNVLMALDSVPIILIHR